MSASSQLRKFYEQWRALTEQEGRAIRAADWARVEEFQSEKHRLQAHIQTAGDELGKAARPPGANLTAIERELCVLVEELIVRERENDLALAAQRQIAEEHKAELHQASRQLRQVHQAYAPGRPPLWQSYS